MPERSGDCDTSRRCPFAKNMLQDLYEIYLEIKCSVAVATGGLFGKEEGVKGKPLEPQVRFRARADWDQKQVLRFTIWRSLGAGLSL